MRSGRISCATWGGNKDSGLVVMGVQCFVTVWVAITMMARLTNDQIGHYHAVHGHTPRHNVALPMA